MPGLPGGAGRAGDRRRRRSRRRRPPPAGRGPGRRLASLVAARCGPTWAEAAVLVAGGGRRRADPGPDHRRRASRRPSPSPTTTAGATRPGRLDQGPPVPRDVAPNLAEPLTLRAVDHRALRLRLRLRALRRDARDPARPRGLRGGQLRRRPSGSPRRSAAGRRWRGALRPRLGPADRRWSRWPSRAPSLAHPVHRELHDPVREHLPLAASRSRPSPGFAAEPGWRRLVVAAVASGGPDRRLPRDGAVAGAAARRRSRSSRPTAPAWAAAAAATAGRAGAVRGAPGGPPPCSSRFAAGVLVVAPIQVVRGVAEPALPRRRARQRGRRLLLRRGLRGPLPRLGAGSSRSPRRGRSAGRPRGPARSSSPPASSRCRPRRRLDSPGGPPLLASPPGILVTTAAILVRYRRRRRAALPGLQGADLGRRGPRRARRDRAAARPRRSRGRVVRLVGARVRRRDLDPGHAARTCEASVDPGTGFREADVEMGRALADLPPGSTRARRGRRRPTPAPSSTA